jgi:hypothetical protein
MSMTRKQFCLGLGGGAMLALVSACGDGAKNTAGASVAPNPQQTDTSPTNKNCHDTAIVANHGHVLTINPADLTSTTTQSYDITGTADHSHTVSLTAEQLALLKAGTSLTVTSGPSSTAPSHTHQITLACV